MRGVISSVVCNENTSCQSQPDSPAHCPSNSDSEQCLASPIHSLQRLWWGEVITVTRPPFPRSQVTPCNNRFPLGCQSKIPPQGSSHHITDKRSSCTSQSAAPHSFHVPYSLHVLSVFKVSRWGLCWRHKQAQDPN